MSRLAPRRLLASLAVAAAALVVALLVHGGAGGATPTPSTIARGLPGGAVAYLEAPDLRALLAAYRGSAMRRAFDGSRADASMRQGLLFLRLGERVAALEQIAGFELTWDRLLALVGKDAGLAVYDLPDTRFVLVSRLAAGELTAAPLLQARQRFAGRKHAGLEFFVHEKPGQPTLAFAVLGDRLLVSNDLPHFRDALVLTAREIGQKVDGKAAAPLAADPFFPGLLAASPADASLRVFVRLDRIRGTHHFDDFWIFDWATGGASPRLDGLEATLLSARVGAAGRASETRVSAVAADRRDRVLAGLPKAPGADLDAACAALPPGLLTSVSQGDAARRLLWLLPYADRVDDWGAPTGEDPRLAAAPALEAVLARSGAGRVLDVVSLSTTTRPDGATVVRRHGAVAVRLATPGALDVPALEAALVAPVSAALGRRISLAFTQATDSSGRFTLHGLRIPLVEASEWQLTLIPPGPSSPWLIVATSAAGAADLATRLGQPALAGHLEAGAPACGRIDLLTARARWTDLAATLERGPWSAEESRALVTQVVPDLFAALGLREVITVAHRRDEYHVEQVEYRW
jgi:hypothetical protein